MNAAKYGSDGNVIGLLLLRVLGPLRGAGVYVALGLTVVAVIGAATVYLWRRHGETVRNDPRYRLKLENVQISQCPEWIRSDVKSQAILLGSLSEPDIREVDLTVRMAQAFAMHPWVAEVRRVSKDYPPRVTVDLQYRRPVAMVEVHGGLLPVDGTGVLLPPGDFSSNDAIQYPRIAIGDSTPLGAEGTAWGDARVHGAAEIANLLQEKWHTLSLHEIRLSGGQTRQLAGTEATFEILPREGTRVVWGHSPGNEAPGEPTAPLKVARLTEYVKRNGPLTATGGPEYIDLRHSTVSNETPRTARRGN